MKKHRNLAALLMAALLFLVPLLPMQTLAAANDGLSLTVTHNSKCGEASTFTIQADGGSGNYQYYFGNITREGEDGRYYVMDPSRLPGFKDENTFDFTFYASGVYYLEFHVMDKGVTPIITKREIVKVVLNDPQYPTIEAIADNVAAQCMASCSTDFDRALWLHDWLLDNCEYDYSYLYCNAEGALARGTGTCEAYHRAYTMLLNRVGIANGRAEGNGHVWTVAKLDGNWYQIDVTWDDNGYSNHTYENYLYFGLDDRIMTLVHSDHVSDNNYLSNSLEQNYFIKTGKIRQWSDSLMPAVQQNLDAGNTEFDIPITDSMNDSYQKVIYNLAAYQLSSQDWSDSKQHAVKLNAEFKLAADTGTYSSRSANQMHITAVYEHNWDDGTITTPATCTTAGVKTYTCSHCTEIRTEEILPNGHTAVKDNAVAPTCTETGLTEGSHCSVCNTVLTAQRTIEAIGHSYDDGIITKPATDSETGIKTYTCSACGNTKTEIIAATGNETDTDKPNTGTNNSEIKDTESSTESADKTESAPTTNNIPQTSEKSPETGASSAKSIVCLASAAACALISATALNKKKKLK